MRTLTHTTNLRHYAAARRVRNCRPQAQDGLFSLFINLFFERGTRMVFSFSLFHMCYIGRIAGQVDYLSLFGHRQSFCYTHSRFGIFKIVRKDNKLLVKYKMFELLYFVRAEQM